MQRLIIIPQFGKTAQREFNNSSLATIGRSVLSNNCHNLKLFMQGVICKGNQFAVNMHDFCNFSKTCGKGYNDTPKAWQPLLRHYFLAFFVHHY